MFQEARYSVEAVWDYWMAMPIAVAVGLMTATLLIFGASVILYVFKRKSTSVSALTLVSPFFLLAIAWIANMAAGQLEWGFLISVLKFTSFIAFLWVVVTFFLILFSNRRD